MAQATPMQNNSKSSSEPFNATGRPHLHERSTVVAPYDPKRIALDKKYEQLLEQGDRALTEDPAAAEGYYREAASLDSYRNDAWKGLGRALDAQGKTAQALSAYHQAFESPAGLGEYSTFPNDIETLARYGTLCEASGQHEAAVRAYQKAQQQLNPRPNIPMDLSPEAQAKPTPQLTAMLEVVRGLALNRQNKAEEAVTAFKHAAALQPNDERVQFYLGYGYRKAGQFAAAQSAFQKAANLDPEGTVAAATEENIRAVQAHRR